MRPQLQLIGFQQLRKDLGALGRFQSRVNREMNRKSKSYRTQARDIVRQVVYSKPENPQYPRSGNLLAATDVSVMKDQADTVVVYVFLNPDRASRSFSYMYVGQVDPQGLLSYYTIVGKGGPTYYPSYVRRGVFFRKKLPARDFRSAWLDIMGPIYKRDVARAIRKFK